MRALLGGLFLLGVALTYWRWLLAIVVIVALAKGAELWWADVQADQAARRKRAAGLIARADEQHAQVMSGDERGIWGRYPPAC